MARYGSLALFLAAIAFAEALQAQPTTYDFSGTVTNATGTDSFVSAGQAISGMFAIDYGAANAAQSYGAPGGPGTWGWYSSGGSSYGTTAPSSLMFTMSAQVGAFSFSNGSAFPFATGSEIGGGAGVSFSNFLANSEASSSQGVGWGASLGLVGGALGSGAYPFNSNGMPIFVGSGSGSFQTLDGTTTGELDFSLDSITPASAVPEPRTFEFLGCGLAFLALGAWRRAKQGTSLPAEMPQIMRAVALSS
jgi:hypothetical protein